MNWNTVRKAVMPALMAGLCLSLAACGESAAPASYTDGVYDGRSADYQDDSDGNGAGYGEVTIEIKDNSIVSCSFATYELDGTLKDENYGADLSKENRLKAQKAVQASEKYASMLAEAGQLDGVDAISGATISYNAFVDAVNDALSKAAN